MPSQCVSVSWCNNNPAPAVHIRSVVYFGSCRLNCVEEASFIISVTSTGKQPRRSNILVFLFITATCFGCVHQPLSSVLRFTKTVKRGEASLYKVWREIITIIK